MRHTWTSYDGARISKNAAMTSGSAARIAQADAVAGMGQERAALGRVDAAFFALSALAAL